MHQVAVIGAGPLGLEVSVALKKAAIDYVHFEAKQVGATFAWFTRGTQLYSHPESLEIGGLPLRSPNQSRITREQYIDYLFGVVKFHELEIKTFEPVTRIAKLDGGFSLRTFRGGEPQSYSAANIVFATGSQDSPRLLNIPGEDMPHVSHYLDDPQKYFHRRVVVVGGRDSAIESALRLHGAGAIVTVIHRGEKFGPKIIKPDLLAELNYRIREHQIDSRMNCEADSIWPDSVAVKGEFIAADAVFLMTGYKPDYSLPDSLGVGYIGGIPTIHADTMESTIPGVCFAGTIADRHALVGPCKRHVVNLVAYLARTELAKA